MRPCSLQVLHPEGYVHLDISITYLASCLMCSQNVVASDVPSNMQDLVMEKRRELIEVVSEVDDQLAEAFLNDEPIQANQLKVR